MAIPDSLRHDGLDPFWSALRAQLDRNRERRPATLRRTPLDAPAERALRALLGGAFRSRIDLDVLERELVVRQIGSDLDDVLTKLGYPPSPAAERRRVDATRRRDARRALEVAIADWPYPWADEWAAGIVASGNLGGLEPDDVTNLASDVARVMRLMSTPELSSARVDVAAMIFGDAHALDSGLRRTNWLARALRHVVGDLDGRDLWTAAGLWPDQVSAPVLVWGLEGFGNAPAVGLLAAANRRVPVHLSLLALRGRLQVPIGTRVLVAENPRVVEYAAERRLPIPVISTNGNPSTAVQTLVDYLIWSDADVRYHGDFDAAGLAICGRMLERGCRPWKMDVVDYEAALHQADEHDVRLDRDERRCGETTWDPDLASIFNRDRLIVHEEFVLPELFSAVDW
jgi:uncharacterized protein (TIGR02679 family)